METIFDYNPTASELKAIGIDYISMTLRHGLNLPDPVSKDVYQAAITQDAAYLDLALLFEHRADQEQADAYWQKIPALQEQYLLGFDELAIIK